MKCLICGTESNNVLCDSCNNQENVALLFHLLGDYGAELDNYPIVEGYISGFEKKTEARRILIDIAKNYNGSDADYYLCRAYTLTYDEAFENSALEYLEKHKDNDSHRQRVLLDLLNTYVSKVFSKPETICKGVLETDGLFSELYYKVAEYYATVGDYDVSESLITKTLEKLNNGTCSPMIYPLEREVAEFEKLKGKVEKYRTVKPYWPNNPEKRRIVAEIYDAKGIEHPRIEPKPKKVSEADFKPISEMLDPPNRYVSFWCTEVFNTVAKDICEIGAITIDGDTQIDSFHSYIKPWKSNAAAIGRLNLARELQDAPDVDFVIDDFIKYIGNDPLVAPGALESQGNLLTRAFRYAGKDHIDNEFFDLLDYADDTSDSFDVWTRDKLIERFGLADGGNALEKAIVNNEIYNALRKNSK